MTRLTSVLAIFSLAAPLAPAQRSAAPADSINQDAPQREEDFRVYTDAPRLLLTKQRLRLLQRERERMSPRWEQLDALVAGGAPMPEPGFANALYYRVANDAPAGRRAVEWAAGTADTPSLGTAKGAATLRQLALVSDWCAPVATKAQTDRIAAKLQQALTASASTLPDQAARAFAAIALADRAPEQSEAALRSIATWFRAELAKGPTFPREHAYALFELLHAFNDNLKIDLRDGANAYFENYPTDHLAGHYPAPFPGADNFYRVPVYFANGEPNLTDMVLSRAAELAMVSFDTNALENQFVQGWLMQDPFTMRDELGAPYEFLWANPYQPGLSYTHEPLVFHNGLTGHLFARTSWDEDATWIGYFDGHIQLFRDGSVQTLKTGGAVQPVHAGGAMMLTAPAPLPDGTIRFDASADAVFLIGLAPKTKYDVEPDDQELLEATSDAGGILVLAFPPEVQGGVRLHRALLQ